MTSDYEAIWSRAQLDIGFREITGTPTSDSAFGRLLSETPLEDWLQTVGKLSKRWSDLRPGDSAADRALAQELGLLRRAALVNIDQGGRFVSDGSLNTVAREALFGSPERPPTSWPQGVGDLARGLLSVVDLFEDERPTTDAEEALMSLLLRRIARPSPPLRSTLPRTHRLFVDLPRRHPELVTFDLDAQAQKLVGLPVERFIALCMTFFVRFDQAQAPDGWLLTRDYYATTSISGEEFERVAKSFAATPEQLRSEYQKEFDAGFTGLNDHRPLVVTPLCEVRPGVFIPIDFAALAHRLWGDGMYWRLRPTDADGKTRYGATMGRLLEQHLWEIARDIYPEGQTPEQDQLFRERNFHGFDGPDISIFDPDALVICEIGVDQVNVRDTLHRGSLAAFDADVNDVLLPRIAQLRRKIDAIRSGEFKFPRHVGATTHIEPVVCLLDGFPIAPLLRARIDNAIKASKLLELPDVGRVSILSADEFELGCATVEQGHTTYSQLLAGHAQNPNTSQWPFRDHIRAVTGEQPWTQLVETEFLRVVQDIATEIAAQ